jgi:hypothetical protein
MASASPADTRIDAFAPAPRTGLLGSWDRFIGPGATPAENALAFGSALAGVAWIVCYGLLGPVEWSAGQITVLTLIGGDLLGGAVADASRPTTRWYHRSGQGLRQQLGFTARHLGYIGLIAWLFRGLDVAYFVWVSLALLLSAGVVFGAAPALRRPLAAGLVARMAAGKRRRCGMWCVARSPSPECCSATSERGADW